MLKDGYAVITNYLCVRPRALLPHGHQLSLKQGPHNYTRTLWAPCKQLVYKPPLSKLDRCDRMLLASAFIEYLFATALMQGERYNSWILN
jgi:hypothetical protein